MLYETSSQIKLTRVGGCCSDQLELVRAWKLLQLYTVLGTIYCLAKVLWTGQTKNCILFVDPSVCFPCLVRHLRLTRMVPVSLLFVYDLVVWSSSSPCPKKLSAMPPLLRGAYIIPALIVSNVLCCSARHLLLHINIRSWWILMSYDNSSSSAATYNSLHSYFSVVGTHLIGRTWVGGHQPPSIFNINTALCQTSCPLRTVH